MTEGQPATVAAGTRADVEVLIVGGGPTGMTLANLLGRAGRDVMLVERNEGTSNEPRAVSFDDESLRTLQACGLAWEAYEQILQGTGTKYFGANGRPLAYARGPVRPPLGHPVKNPFSQPKFERMLQRGLVRFANVVTRFSTELTALELNDGSGAQVTLRRADGALEQLHARFVIGCDGGRSTVRGLLGITMEGSSFEEPWLVVDTLEDEHDERYAMHHCDPRRPYVIVAGRDGHCRYEFMLLPGEDASQLSQLDAVQSLLAPFREVSEAQLERRTVYTFHALAAARWRAGPVLLAGDAAHMMPPFAGQGLNSGIRDVTNLAWKLNAVLSGLADERLLDTYEAERRPHAEASTRFSVRLGRVMMSRNVPFAHARDLVIRGASKIPAVHRYISENRFKPLARYGEGGALLASDGGGELLGRMFPQPEVLRADGTRPRLDEVLGDGFALLAVAPDPDSLVAPTHPTWRALSPRLVALVLDDRAPRPGPPWSDVVADIDGTLARLLDRYRGRVILIRPDRFVAAALPPGLDECGEAVAAALSLAGGAAELGAEQLGGEHVHAVGERVAGGAAPADG